MKDNYKPAVRAAIEAGEKILEIYNKEDFGVERKEDDSPLTRADKAAHKIIVDQLSQSPSPQISPSPVTRTSCSHELGYASVPILSEEGREIPFAERSQWKRFWLVDPLDGTKEFIKRNGEFTVNIALIEDGTVVFGVVYAPVLDEVYLGVVGEGAWVMKKEEALKTEGKVYSLKAKVQGNNPYRVVASRSHLNTDTEEYLEKVREEKGEIEVVSKGSSLKLCMVACGEADEYPRLGPTMEWDVAAAHAVVKGSGKNVYDYNSGEELQYNKEDLLNPYFIVK